MSSQDYNEMLRDQRDDSPPPTPEQNKQKDEEKKLREEKRKAETERRTKHFIELENIETMSYVSISELHKKYVNITTKDIREWTRGYYTGHRELLTLLEVKKEKGRWKCSKERLDACDVLLIKY